MAKDVEKSRDISRLKNKNDYEIRKQNGFCVRHPARKSLPGKSTCDRCVILRKAYKTAAKNSSICPSHPSAKIVPGKKCCQKCLNDQKIRRIDRIQKGICPFDNNPIATGARECDECTLYGRSVCQQPPAQGWGLAESKASQVSALELLD